MHYAIYSARRLMLVQADSTVGAIGRFIVEEDQDARIASDGSVTTHYFRREVTYPHVLAYIEANYKGCDDDEWRICQLPEWVWDASYVQEALTLTEAETIAYRISQARPLFRKEFPRSRAPGFVWYLTDRTVMVTFFRQARPMQIEILRRYLVPQDPWRDITEWTGTYDDTVAQLWLGWLPRDRPEHLDDPAKPPPRMP